MTLDLSQAQTTLVRKSEQKLAMDRDRKRASPFIELALLYMLLNPYGSRYLSDTVQAVREALGQMDE